MAYIENPFLRALHYPETTEEAQAGYFSYQDQWKTPNQKKYFQNQFADVQNRYRGLLGQQVFGGGEPNLSFADFLGKYFAPQGGAAQEWASMTPQQKGFNYSQFAPRTRWIV